MSNFYLEQVVRSIRVRGLSRTVEYAWARVFKEDVAPVPMRERVWLNRHGFKPVCYFLYNFPTKTPDERFVYLSDRANAVLARANTRFAAPLRNKLLYHRFMRDHPVVLVPELVAFIDAGRIVDARPPYGLRTPEDMFEDDEELVIKPVTGSRGHGVMRVRRGDERIRGALAASGGHGFVVVRVVQQAPYAARINPGSANTVRIVGMRDPATNEVFVPVAVHRFGVAHTGHVDNWSAGGVSCAIDIDSGRMGPGVRHPRFTGWRVAPVAAHPETEAALEGIHVPRWGELLRTVQDLMATFPDLHYAAWDMLATEAGWCAIEGNEVMDVDLLQIHGGMLADPRVRRFADFFTVRRR